MSSDIIYFWSGDSFNNRDAMVPIISICGVPNGISKVRADCWFHCLSVVQYLTCVAV